MTRSYEERCCRKLQTACTNVIGFGQLLQEPVPRKIDQVKRLQYRAYMIGSALTLADLVIEHGEAIAEIFPDHKAQDLQEVCQAYKTLVVSLDGNDQCLLHEQTMFFGHFFLGVFQP